MKLTLTFLVIAVILVGILIRGINRMVLEGHNKVPPDSTKTGIGHSD